jgi:hypothetical protein
MSDVEPTPSQDELEKKVKVDMVEVEETVEMEIGLPVTAKLAHVLAALVSGVLALCVATVLADGTSVIKLKPVAELPVATDPSLESAGIHHRLDELLGQTYGVGLHHDQSGRSWTDIGAESTLSYLVDQLGVPVVVAALPRVISTDALKHPVPFLECDDLQKAGLAAMSLGCIAEATSVLMIFFHCLVLAGLLPSKIAKPLAILVWLVLTAGFLIVVMLATGIYTAEWTCNNPVIPTITLSEHFNYSYGFVFAIIGFISSLLVLVVTICATATTDGTTKVPAKKSLGSVLFKILCGVVTGMVVGAVASFIVLGGTNGLAAPEVGEDVNPCYHQKPYHAGPGDNYFSNTDCFKDSVTQTLEQAGANVTRGYVGGMDAGDRVPITERYSEVGLCPVNVHWHLGAEHLSVGQFDFNGTGPDTWYTESGSGSSSSSTGEDYRRGLAGKNKVRLGNRCHHYDKDDPIYTTAYDWKYCTNMEVGETYEIHWPHSAAGDCGTKYQYQSPFYDGVFCHDGIITIAPLNTYEKIGVEGQIFTVVNDEDYYYDDLISGMIVSDDKGRDIAMYTGSTTGTSRDNEVCSRYTPITWQVDRYCHKISASSFDKLCADMLTQADDMSMDVHPHGSREVSATAFVANKQQS